jgi:hypothetical protein
VVVADVRRLRGLIGSVAPASHVDRTTGCDRSWNEPQRSRKPRSHRSGVASLQRPTRGERPCPVAASAPRGAVRSPDDEDYYSRPPTHTGPRPSSLPELGRTARHPHRPARLRSRTAARGDTSARPRVCGGTDCGGALRTDEPVRSTGREREGVQTHSTAGSVAVPLSVSGSIDLRSAERSLRG